MLFSAYYLSLMSQTRPGVDNVKTKVWFRYFLWIGNFIMVQKGRLKMFSLNMLGYPMIFISLYT